MITENPDSFPNEREVRVTYLGDRQKQLVAGGLMASAAAVMLCGYEFIRSTTNTLFKAYYGAENLPYVIALSPLMVLGVLYVYGEMLRRMGPRRTLFWTTLGSGLFIGLCYLGVVAGIPLFAAVLYLFREAYVVLLIEQYWSYLNSTFDIGTGKRLNGPVTGISSLGAILGGLLVHQLSESLGSAHLLGMAAALLIPAAILSDLGYARTREPEPRSEEEKQRGHFGLASFRESPLLLYLFGVVITTQILSAAVGLNFQTLLQIEIPEVDRQNAYSGMFYAKLNALAAVFQFVGAPLLMRWLPVFAVHFLLPVVHIATSVILILKPTLGTAALAYLAFKVLDYSLFRAAKEVLYIPLSFDARFRAKEMIDVFGYRFGKGGASLAIKFGGILRGAAAQGLAGVALGASVLWLALLVPARRHFRQAAAADGSP